VLGTRIPTPTEPEGSAISIVQLISRNLMIADLIAVIASLDLVAPEIDR